MLGIHSAYSGIGIVTQLNGHSILFRLFPFRNRVNRTQPKSVRKPCDLNLNFDHGPPSVSDMSPSAQGKHVGR